MKSLNLNAPRRRHISVVSIILFIVVIVLLALAFFEVFQIRDESGNDKDEIKNLTAENEKYQKEIADLKKKNEELENAPISVNGFYSASADNQYYEILLNEGVIILSTEVNGSIHCFYGTYNMEGNNLTSSFTTGLDPYNKTITVPNIKLTANKDNTLTYLEGENPEITLNKINSNEVKHIGKTFRININP